MRPSDLRLLRASIGRHREEASLQASDEELVAHVVADLSLATGQQLRPVDAHVQRWGGALPQYAVGHLDRVARIRAAVDAVPGLEVCGAAYDGVGIPAVIGSARRAAASLTRGRIDPMSEQSNAARTREINEMIRYTMWSVFRLDQPLGPDDGGADRGRRGGRGHRPVRQARRRRTSSSAAPTTSPACAPTPT